MSSLADQPLTKTDMAYARLKRSILTGEYPPEMSLDQEMLAAGMGLSTTPVREALRRLEAERLVVARAHRDTIVAPLSKELLEEAYTVRLALDPLAVRLAAQLMTPEERKQLRAMGSRTADNSRMSQLDFNRELHRCIYSACRNQVLIDVLDSLWDLTDRYRLLSIKDDLGVKVARKEHGSIIDAVARGDGDVAADLMRDHVAKSLARIRSSNV